MIKIIVRVKLFLLLLFSIQAKSQEIFEAIKKGELDKVQIIIKNNPSAIHTSDENGKSTIHLAAEYGQTSIIEYLLSSGVNINTETKFKTTALHFATFKNHIQTVKFLIEKGANVNILNLGGAYPIDFAVRIGNLELVKLLTEKGANLNNKGANGATILHNACKFGKKEIVEYFIEKGLQIDCSDDLDATPLFYAAENGFGEIVSYLILKKEHNFNIKTKNGSTYLHAASSGGLLDFTKLLIRKGVQVNLANIYGYTPLYLAVKNGKKDIVVYLIENGADMNFRNYIGESAYNMAKTTNQTDIIQILKKFKADTTIIQNLNLKKDYFGLKKPSLVPEIFAPGIISTPEYNERDITYSPDKTEMFFSRYPLQKIMTIMTMKFTGNVWTKPQPASFMLNYNHCEANFTPDGKQLYFISTRPVSEKGEEDSWEIWKITKNADSWSEPHRLGDNFKGGFYPTFTQKDVMYFTANDENIHKSFLEQGEYKKSENLGDSVNTKEAEFNSCISPDESYLIFTSTGWGEGYGSNDLYICFRKKDGSWTKAKNMGPVINTKAKEYCPSITADGKYLFFSSSRYGTEDIFWIDAKVIEGMKPNDLK